MNHQVERWNTRYSDERYVFGERPNDFLVEAEVMVPRGGRVLVIGDGEGRNGVWLASKGHRVTTVDLSEVGVAKARALAESRGVELDAHVGDLETWLDTEPAQGPWDAVVSIFVHLPPELRPTVSRTLASKLSRRGVLILEAYTPAQLALGTGGPQDEAWLLTRERVLHDFADLVLDIRITERRIFEGFAHQGLSAVVQVLGRPKPQA